jgi:HD superfamily phosphohydrolase
MTLTGILGGDEAEQAAGLLQDLSHTAFSHTIDYVFDDRGEEFHERIFQSVIEQSDVPEILERYGLTWQALFSGDNLVRVDSSAPLLCADRIDYTLRDLVRLGYLAAGKARAFVRQLEFLDGKVVSTDVESAARFVEWYSHLVGEVFMNPLELYVHDAFAKLIRQALQEGVLSEEDLLATDDVVLAKLLADETHGLDSTLAGIRRVRNVAVGDSAHGVRVYSKGRKIDPPVLEGGLILPLSHVRPETLDKWAKVEKTAAEGIVVREVPVEGVEGEGKAMAP